MSAYVRYYKNRKEFYKTFATRWAAWAVKADLTDLEVEGMSKVFKHIAKRFGLIHEFTELGILHNK